MSRLSLSLALCASLVVACDKGGGGEDDKPAEAGESASQAKTAAGRSASTSDESAKPDATPAPTCPKASGERVALMAEDGVELAADHYSPGIPGARSVVLLHMIPPHHSLANYPRSVIEALVGAGFEVINVNRRGAPGSKGIAEQAYEGDKGKLDALAGVRFLLDSPCKADPSKLVIVGASNGTTSMVDYAVHASAADDAKTPVPAALVFLSGGAYTENQNPLADSLGALAKLPAFFAYPKKEAEWNDETKSLVASESIEGWSFHVYEPGGHGTNLFKTDPEIVTELVTWLDAHVSQGS